MPSSKLFRAMNREVRLIGKTYLNFKPRLAGNYTRRQMSAAAAYTLFCHAEFESFLEGWATTIIEFAETNWKSNRATKPLVHLCTFHSGRGVLSGVPPKDEWNAVVFEAINQHKKVIKDNNGIKEASLCRLLSPVGFDTRKIDPILLADLSAFGSIRGDHAHQSHQRQLGQNFDPFDRQMKAEALVSLLEVLDGELVAYMSQC